MVGLLYSPGVISQAYAPLVGLLSFGTLAVLGFQTLTVGKHRKLAAIRYPQLYATEEQVAKDRKALVFNCCQRAHANTLETLAYMVPCTAVLGLRYPNIAAVAYAIYLAGRVAYTLGYSTGKPAARMRGGFGYLGQIPIIFGALIVSLEGVLYGQ